MSPALKLAATGCCGARSSLEHGGRLVDPLEDLVGEAVRRVAVLCGDATGVKLVADPANRLLVNVGSVPVVPAGLSGLGQAHRPLLLPGRGGGLVVVVGVTTHLGGRESRPQGEGVQRGRSSLVRKEVVGEYRRAAGRSR